MPRRFRSLLHRPPRTGVAAQQSAPLLGIGALGLSPHVATAVPLVAPVSGGVLAVLSGYLAILVVLIVFGIWGFRSGTGGSGGDGGGGSKKPGPESPPPGGMDLRDDRPASRIDLRGMPDFQAWEAQLRSEGDTAAEPDRRERIPLDAPLWRSPLRGG